MPQFDELIDQERPLRILAGILAKGNIPHAFLLTGIDGIGKRTTAIRFAMMQNCHGLQSSLEAVEKGHIPGFENTMTACGRCNACVKIMAGSHPDVILIEPEGDVIKIAQVRELSRRLAFKSHEARARVVVFSDAQAMNTEASNALLKSLEEPPAQTFFFLTARQRTDLLPTVVSRCQHIRFNPVSSEKIAAYLNRVCGLDHPAARLAAIISDGSFSKALSLSERPESLRDLALWRQWLVDEMINLPSRPIPGILMFAQRLTADKNRLALSFEIMKRFLRDAMVVHYCPEKIANTDLCEAVNTLSRANSLSAIFSKIDAVSDTEQAVLQHANLRLSLETMAMRLAGQAA